MFQFHHPILHPRNSDISMQPCTDVCDSGQVEPHGSDLCVVDDGREYPNIAALHAYYSMGIPYRRYIATRNCDTCTDVRDAHTRHSQRSCIVLRGISHQVRRAGGNAVSATAPRRGVSHIAK